jgi:hypothetical protein
MRVPKDESGRMIERPGMVVYDVCKAFLRTIPALCMDEDNPEDVDTDQEDHVYDEACHACMAKRTAGGQAISQTVDDVLGNCVR